MQSPVVVLVGAGLSTASGIPDYRSDNGMWQRFDPDEFHITRFHRDPARFWDRRVELVREMRLFEAEPNAAHHALARSARDGRIATIVTQNIDGLHQKAGTPADRLIEVHGNSTYCVCVRCGAKERSVDVIADHVPGRAPTCMGCGGLLKPDVVLFGEPVTRLPEAQQAVASARTLVAIGTSLQVWPVAGLVPLALERGAALYVANRDRTPFDAHATEVLRGEVVDAVVRLFS